MSADLLTLYGALGLEPGRVHAGGRHIGSAHRLGSKIRYSDTCGRNLGYAEMVGSEVVLRDANGRTIQRFRVRRER